MTSDTDSAPLLEPLVSDYVSIYDVKKAIGFDGVVLPCSLLDLLSGLAEQARAWQLLAHLADKRAPNLHVAANRLGREIERSRSRED